MSVEINKAIAEKVMGWRVFRPCDVKYRSSFDKEFHGTSEEWLVLTKKHQRPATHMIDSRPLPNFCLDLNGAAAAERAAITTDVLKFQYTQELEKTQGNGTFEIATATAEQRCLAILAVLEIEAEAA